MKRARQLAYRVRHGLLAAVIFLWVVWFATLLPPGWFGLPSTDAPLNILVITPPMMPVGLLSESVDHLLPSDDGGAAATNLLCLALLLTLQVMVLRPGRGMAARLTTHLPRRHWRFWLSITAAAFMAMALTIAWGATLLEVPNLYEPVMEYVIDTWLYGIPILLMMWLVWGVLLWLYSRPRDEWTWLTRVTRCLLVGSFAETLVATAVHALVYNRDDCWCARGSYAGMVLGGAVLCWALGPAIVLLYLAERRRRAEVLSRLCVNCGYDLRGTMEAGRAVCPECGVEHTSRSDG